MKNEGEISEKARKYDEMIKKRSEGGKKAWAGLSKEERSKRAKKAVQARIRKYNQKGKA